jgi:23S rRNA pseudouridine2605 synthase
MLVHIMKERLQKYLARCGVASRRKSEEYIAKGLVTVNGKRVIEMGIQIDPKIDKITFKQKPVRPAKELIYLILNKPIGVITTTDDPEKRETVMDLISGIDMRLFPVGRLDADSEGLLILTNDGAVANRLAHPRYGVKKKYRVLIKGEIQDSSIKKLERGVLLEDGITAPAKVSIDGSFPNETRLTIEIAEGKKRQIRRMFEEVGHLVSRLIRIQYGPLHIGKLKPGEYRHLTTKELTDIKKLLS